MTGADRSVPDQPAARAEAQVAAEGGEVDRDQHARGVAAVQREPARVDRLEEGAEGVAEPLVVGTAVVGTDGAGHVCGGRVVGRRGEVNACR